MKTAKIISIKQYITSGTIETLELLLKKALEGEIVGIVFGVKLSDHTYSTGSTGDFKARPSEALISLSVLADSLQEKKKIKKLG